MTDRELLEMAAKAAGIDIGGMPVESYWNPLTDDGEAFRLAVALSMNIDVGPKAVGFTEASVIFDDMRIGAEEYHDSNPTAATRRAIVRAAAAIGRTME